MGPYASVDLVIDYENPPDWPEDKPISKMQQILTCTGTCRECGRSEVARQGEPPDPDDPLEKPRTPAQLRKASLWLVKKNCETRTANKPVGCQPLAAEFPAGVSLEIDFIGKRYPCEVVGRLVYSKSGEVPRLPKPDYSGSIRPPEIITTVYVRSANPEAPADLNKAVHILMKWRYRVERDEPAKNKKAAVSDTTPSLV